MTAFENAQKFFAACEAGEGWAGCKQNVADDAPFVAQSQPLAEIVTVEGYSDWMAGVVSVTPGFTYKLHASCYDEENSTAIFFATYRIEHTGEEEPVSTHKETNSYYYVYVLTMNQDNKVAK